LILYSESTLLPFQLVCTRVSRFQQAISAYSVKAQFNLTKLAQ
jgi:hypothetical protein